MSRMNAPGGEIEGSVLGKIGTAETMVGVFAACGASFGSNGAGQYHQLQSDLLFGLKNPIDR